MSKSLKAACMALAVAASLAACSSNDMDRLMGRDDSNNNNNSSNSNNDSNRRASSNAVSVCADAAQKRGWTVLNTHDTGTSGQNNIEVEMSVRQSDGDVRDVTCTYDTGRNDARLES